MFVTGVAITHIHQPWRQIKMTTKQSIAGLILFMILGFLLAANSNTYLNRNVTFERSSIPFNIQGKVVSLSVIKSGENNLIMFQGEHGFTASIKTIEVLTGQKLCFVNKVRTLKIEKVVK